MLKKDTWIKGKVITRSEHDLWVLRRHWGKLDLVSQDPLDSGKARLKPGTKSCFIDGDLGSRNWIEGKEKCFRRQCCPDVLCFPLNVFRCSVVGVGEQSEGECIYLRREDYNFSWNADCGRSLFNEQVEAPDPSTSHPLYPPKHTHTRHWTKDTQRHHSAVPKSFFLNSTEFHCTSGRWKDLTAGRGGKYHYLKNKGPHSYVLRARLSVFWTLLLPPTSFLQTSIS